MKHRLLMVICQTALLVGAVPVQAHEPMNHGCTAPSRPVDDQNDLLWSQFLQDIDAFQTCITNAADRHQAASDAHQRAAFAAVDAWNDFVRTSLNAPEDFPWPPEEN
jgi:hypothetical protein